MPVSQAKEDYAQNLNRLLDTYSRVLFCDVTNVTSQQLHHVRRDLRGKGEMLNGKKTLQKKIISLRAESDNATELDRKMAKKLCDQEALSGNLALVFTNGTAADIKAVFITHKLQAPARVGVVAPVDVIVPAGNTGLEPTMTSFFQALNLPTKISKGTVEILSDKKVLTAGEKVDSSTSALLQKLKISPFFYAVETEMMWDNGIMFMKEDLETTDESIEASLMGGINNLTALSLGAGVVTECSFPHLILGGFKNLLAASVASDYVFEEYGGKQKRQDILDGKGAAAPAPAAAAAAPAAKKPKTPTPSESDDDVGLGGLF